MQTAEVSPSPQFNGSENDQQAAQQLFQTMRGMGRFFPRYAPIRATVSTIAEYLASRNDERDTESWTAAIERLAELNPDVFDLEELDGAQYIITTQDGLAPAKRPVTENIHSLARRFAEPKPRPEGAERRFSRRRQQDDVLQPEPQDNAELEAYLAARGIIIPSGETAGAAPLATEEQSQPLAEETDLELDVIEDEPAETPVASVSSVTTLEEALTVQLRQDLTVANFGDLWLAEDRVPRLSRGDLRRIREYILERGQPLTDEVLIQDVLNVRPTADDYELMRFAINYRLSVETREFEFVGTADQRLWSTQGLPVIGTSKRKASELGHDYRYLLDDNETELEPGESVVEHVLTFYEYQYGVLPYGGELASILPKPFLEGQRAAVLTFESPQTYETFLVELRFPTGNRGGYLAGFDRFVLENLVPGALFTIEFNEETNRYLIEYLPVSGENRKLLQVDEKKGRYVFRPMTFYCATRDDMVLSENRLPQFANASPLEDRVRRRPELALAATFERIGEQVGTPDEPRLMAMLDDLLPAANIERPVSADLVRRIVESDEFPEFTSDPDVEDVFYYQPAGQ